MKLKKEFLDYIQQNGYNPKFLCSKFGISDRTCRKWKRDFLLKGGILPITEDKRIVTSIEGQIISREEIDIEKNKMKDKNISFLFKENIKEYARVEYLIDKIKEIIPPINNIPYKPFKVLKDNEKDEEVMILDLSDCQIGKKTKSYDTNIFKNRLETLFNNLIKVYLILIKSYNIKKLYINLLGDLVEGESIFPSQPYQIDCPVINQVFKVGLPSLQKFILNLLPYFEEIEINFVPGNHGRNSKFNSKETNWDIVLGEALKSSLINYENIKINISHEFYTIVDINGINHLLLHGHQIKMARHVPFYMIIDKLIKFALTLEKDWKIAHMGHFHQPQRISILNDRTCFINSSFDSGCEFVQELGGKNVPSQNLFLSSKNRGVTAHYLIDLF